MSDRTETMLRAAMGREVTGLAAPEGMVARAALAGARRRARRQAALSVAAVAVTAAGLVGGVNYVTTGRSAATAPAGPSVTQGPLEQASDAMRATTFRLHVTDRSVLRGEPLTNVDFTGVYDPATGSAEGKDRVRPEEPGPGTEVRLVGGKFFLEPRGEHGKWTTGEGNLSDALLLDGKDASGGVDGSSPDPWTLFRDAARLGSVTPAGSTGPLDHYTYRFRLPDSTNVQAHDVVGKISIDRATHLVASVEQETTVIGLFPEIADGEPLTLRVSATFSDYGVPVAVAAPDPADVQDPHVDPFTGERIDPDAPQLDPYPARG